MRWCADCRRYVRGQPRYCPTCGHTFFVRLCPRGHSNPRHVLFCTECGSGNLSTPARAEDGIGPALHLLPIIGFPIAVGVLLVTLVTGTLLLLDWTPLVPFMVALLIMLAGCYWAITLLPATVRRIGWKAVRRIWNVLREASKESHRRR